MAPGLLRKASSTSTPPLVPQTFSNLAFRKTSFSQLPLLSCSRDWSLRYPGRIKSHANSRCSLWWSQSPDLATWIHITWTKTAQNRARGAATTSPHPP